MACSSTNQETSGFRRYRTGDGFCGRDGRGGDPDTPEASDPTGAISLYEAVEKQVGLKLEKTTRLPKSWSSITSNPNARAQCAVHSSGG